MTAKEKLVLFASNMLPLMPHTFDRFVSLLDAALAEAREGQMGRDIKAVRAAMRIVLRTGHELETCIRRAWAEEHET